MRETGISSGGGGSSSSSGCSHPQQAAVGDEPCGSCRSSSFGRKCSHAVKKQRAKFYIVRRCIAMLVCWRDRGDS